RELRREEFVNLSDDVLEDGVEAGKALLRTPVPYFEAKPQRAVNLNEFVGAVIPENASPETRAILEKHGLAYAVYDPNAGPTAQAEAAAQMVRRLGVRALYSRDPLAGEPRVRAKPIPEDIGQPLARHKSEAKIKADADYVAART